MDRKGYILDQKGLKMYEKRQKMEFSDLKYPLFSGIFISEIGGYPPPPLTENHPTQKPLAGKIRKVVFEGSLIRLNKMSWRNLPFPQLGDKSTEKDKVLHPNVFTGNHQVFHLFLFQVVEHLVVVMFQSAIRLKNPLNFC